jgi:CBS domain-containing protein
MKSVAQLLKGKPNGVASVGPSTSVLEALEMLVHRNIGAVLVMEGSRLLGMFSERDYARRVALQGKSPTATPVSEVMTREVIFVTPEHTNEECMALMTEKRVRHLPVLSANQVVGILSIGDLVKDTISEQEFIISQLVHYIHG